MKRKEIANYGDFLIRIVTGLIFLIAGYSKLTGLDNFIGMLTNIGFPAPGFFALLVALIEVIGGTMLILGLWTYVAAIILAVVMSIAILTVHIPQGWNGIRYPLLLLVVLVRYIGTHGFASVHKLFKKHK